MIVHLSVFVGNLTFIYYFSLQLCRIEMFEPYYSPTRIQPHIRTRSERVQANGWQQLTHSIGSTAHLGAKPRTRTMEIWGTVCCAASDAHEHKV